MFFLIFCGLACEFGFKGLLGPKNFVLSKFELGYQKYAAFHADSKTVEKML
jgi:hypothetical protein